MDEAPQPGALPQPTSPAASMPSTQERSKTPLIIISTVAILIIAGAVLFLYAGHGNSSVSTIASTSIPVTTSSANSSSTTLTSTISQSSAINWVSITSYPIGTFGQSCVTGSGYIYCVGGADNGATNATYYAPLSPTGSIGTWSQSTSYPVAVVDENCVAYGGYIYCGGGTNSSQTLFANGTMLNYYAPISSTGIGTWQPTTSYPVRTQSQSCSAASGYIYCVVPVYSQYFGARQAALSFNAYYATLSAQGIGTWQPTSAPVFNLYATPDCNIASNYIYCVGGNSTAYAAFTPSGIGTWINGSTIPVSGQEGQGAGGQNACPLSSSYIYCTGIGVLDNQTYYAQVSAQGIGQWNAAEGYPPSTVPNSNFYGAQTCTATSGYLYCIGGLSGTGALREAYYTSVQ